MAKITKVIKDGVEYEIGGELAIRELDYSVTGLTLRDTRGPSPEGYHIPTILEWDKLVQIWAEVCGFALEEVAGSILDESVTLHRIQGNETASISFRTHFHIPFAGYRYYSNASLDSQGSYGNYWSSSPYSAGSNSARNLCLHSSYVNANDYYYRASGLSVRCFKDLYVKPDETWTASVRSEKGGIFWSEEKGLISASADGVEWITIADKNLGATEVYNYGDTINANSTAKCGGYYQWGNNYMFPYSGTPTTSQTQVDASSYGPGNYYQSATFIIKSTDWSSVANHNLWGGISNQGTTKKEDHYKLTTACTVEDLVVVNDGESETKSNMRVVFPSDTEGIYIGDTKVRPSS